MGCKIAKKLASHLKINFKSSPITDENKFQHFKKTSHKKILQRIYE